jgi:hypothetical protein
LVIEGPALTLLVWFRQTKPVALSLGVAMHAAIAVIMKFYFFSALMIVSYLCFLPLKAQERKP